MVSIARVHTEGRGLLSVCERFFISRHALSRDIRGVSGGGYVPLGLGVGPVTLVSFNSLFGLHTMIAVLLWVVSLRPIPHVFHFGMTSHVLGATLYNITCLLTVHLVVCP